MQTLNSESLLGGDWTGHDMFWYMERVGVAFAFILRMLEMHVKSI